MLWGRGTTILRECRICGVTVPPKTETCSSCGYAEIAVYEFT